MVEPRLLLLLVLIIMVIIIIIVIVIVRTHCKLEKPDRNLSD